MLASGAAMRAVQASADIDEVDAPAVTPPPEPASAETPAPVASTAAAPAASDPLASRIVTGGGGSGDGSSGGGSSGGGGSGGDPVAPPRDRIFNQDDLMGVVIVVAMLLIALLLFVQNRFGKMPASDDTLVSPQMVASTPPPPPPLPDPFGDAPGDLTPKSPLPEAAPAPVETAPEAPPSTQQTPPAASAAAPPTPPAPEVTACAPGRMVRAYFCTAKSELTPAARTALDREVTAWKACAAGRELVVTGYADTRGSSTYNTWLGGQRATWVAAILRDAGLSVAETTGVGELPGLDDGKNCSNQRRVDVMLKGGTPIPPSTACAPPEDEAPIVCP